MSKPDDIPHEAWETAYQIVDIYCGCAQGRRRRNGTNHSDSCWKQIEATARAIMAAAAIREPKP